MVCCAASTCRAVSAGVSRPGASRFNTWALPPSCLLLMNSKRSPTVSSRSRNDTHRSEGITANKTGRALSIQTSMPHSLKKIAGFLLPVFLSLFAGALLILAAGQNPLSAYAGLFEAGFSCDTGPGRCALVTALQFATPLILSGLSATVALRSGFFSVGQIGQMLFGAAAASWLGGYLSLPPFLHPAVALLGAALLGGIWGLVPAVLKHFVGV